MKRFVALLVVLGTALLPAAAQSYYMSPDVPTDLGANTYLPWDIVRIDLGVYSPTLSLPANTAVDSIHAMCSGEWLLSAEASVELPLGGGVFYDPTDVIRYDPSLVTYTNFFCGGLIGIPSGSNIDAAFLRGADNADLVISFDVPTDLTAIGGADYDPADLVQFQKAGPGCSGWSLVGLFFDGSAATPPVPDTTDVTGADRRMGQTMIAFDVPSTLTANYFPGQVVSWDPAIPTFGVFDAPPWPPNLSSRMDGFSFLPDPGEVPSMHVDKSIITVGDLTITWVPSLSAGAEDYGIYEGTIVSPWTYNHTSIAGCTDSGTPLTEDITPGTGSHFYLVVALNPDMEGSYGRRSIGTERPRGSSPCRPLQGLDCP